MKLMFNRYVCTDLFRSRSVRHHALQTNCMLLGAFLFLCYVTCANKSVYIIPRRLETVRPVRLEIIWYLKIRVQVISYNTIIYYIFNIKYIIT